MSTARRFPFFAARPARVIAGTALAALVLSACGGSDSGSGSSTTSTSPSPSSSASPASSAGSGSTGTAAGSDTGAAGATQDFGAEADTLRLGYFGNLTHAAAVLGVADGTFQEALGDTTLETSVFNAGPAEIEALTGGAIDAGFIGPNPAINSYAKSSGDSLRIVAGATANGAALVVAPDINTVEDLRGKTIATPQLGGTQDVALRKYLLDNNLLVDTTGGDDVSIASQDNATTLDLFKNGDVQGGWLPEPWASRLIVEAGAKELVNEKTLWDDGQFPTTLLIVSRTFLEQYPGTVAKLLQGHLAELDKIEADPADAQTRLNDALAEVAGKPLADGVISRAFAEITPTYDPLANHLTELGEDGVKAGTLKEVPDLSQIYDLRILNQLLVADGKKPVSAGGFGQE
ncbi:ABC transporter substrate-binding protein [Nakamurella deserti]|uniref:ABC transporter substrate-binding protein n=1 Tax=Nakamurella deserti TaxID=2164074 RepID=UPI000DBE4EEB|nr:ABC transporter substrate-binding protein [Nakamurella deserti]